MDPNGSASSDWPSRPTLALGWLWWIGFLVGWILGIIGYGLFDDADGSEFSWRIGFWLVGFGFGIASASAVLGALYIRRVGRALSRKASPVNSTAP